jgi:hypothetical protein
LIAPCSKVVALPASSVTISIRKINDPNSQVRKFNRGDHRR